MTLVRWQSARRRRINWEAVEALALALGIWLAFWGLLLPALINAVASHRGY